ncbi:protein phosphatase 1 regulatory subunit 36 [Polymixia lowei]
MPKHQEETGNVNVPPLGRWDWDDETQTLEFVSLNPTAEDLLKKGRKTKVNFNDLNLRPDRLAQVSTLNDRRRQITRKSLSPSYLNAHRFSEKQGQRANVTIEDVKRKSKEVDEFLSALLLYLSCYFNHKSLENAPKSLMVEQSITEQQVTLESLAKVELAQKKLAVCYSSLIMGVGIEQHHHMACGKSRMSSSHRDRQLYECLYSFSCYVAWVTFDRTDLRCIEEEVGSLLRSDAFNPALRDRTGTLAPDGSAKDRLSTLRQRRSQRRPGLSSIVTQRTPVMVSMLPSPKEQSPHLFDGGRPRRQTPPQAKLCDTAALTEELNQQLANVSIGILGKPLREFSYTTLTPSGAKKQDSDEGDKEGNEDDDDDTDDDPGAHVPSSKASFRGPKSMAVDRRGGTSRTDTGVSRATTEAMFSDTE